VNAVVSPFDAYATLATIRAALGEAEIFSIGFGPQGPYIINFDRSDYADRQAHPTESSPKVHPHF